MSVVLIIVSSIIGLLLIGVNFYILALYCHRINFTTLNSSGQGIWCIFLLQIFGCVGIHINLGISPVSFSGCDSFEV